MTATGGYQRPQAFTGDLGLDPARCSIRSRFISFANSRQNSSKKSFRINFSCMALRTGLPIPKQIVIDGPIVTKANAPGMLWMEEQFLI